MLLLYLTFHIVYDRMGVKPGTREISVDKFLHTASEEYNIGNGGQNEDT